eukprot:11009686-Ditylum_brightwellii.AAC.1
MEFMQEIEANLCGWVETNRPWTEDQKHKTGSQGRQIFNKFKVEAVSSNDPTIGRKQPGGACIGKNGNNVGALVQSGKDDIGLGRWVYACIRGREQRKLYVVVAYRPCKQSNPGDSTVTAQQKR